MRSFEFARKLVDGKPVLITTDKCQVDAEEPAFPDAKLPEYATKYSAGADFFCAEDVIIPSIWSGIVSCLFSGQKGIFLKAEDTKETRKLFNPTLVHTGIKAAMEDDEVLKLYNRSSNPKKGLLLSNGVGVVDADYYNNPENDGEIMFQFINILPWDVKISKGDKLGQGVFEKFYRPTIGLRVKNKERTGGHGSTDRQ